MAIVIRSPHILVRIDLDRVCQNVEAISREVGVPILAVVKADAYGLGATRVAKAIAPLVGGFCTFSLDEAIAARLHETGLTTLTLGPTPGEIEPEEFVEHNARPAVWTAEDAAHLRRARPVLSIDTGMQRFACPADHIAQVLDAGKCDEAFTHATSLEQVQRFRDIVGRRPMRLHAAASALLNEPWARLDAVRPGLALYRGAVRVATKLVEARDSAGPAGYGGFVSSTGRHGVILAGYRNGLRPGPCLINGERRNIVEVGMQSAFIEIASHDQTGDEVVLLGDTLEEEPIAAAWETSAQEVIVRMTGMGERTYAA